MNNFIGELLSLKMISVWMRWCSTRMHALAVAMGYFGRSLRANWPQSSGGPTKQHVGCRQHSCTLGADWSSGPSLRRP